MKAMTLLIAAACMLTAPASAASLKLQDGEYSCSLSPTMILGSVWIHGNKYVGPSRDPKGPSHAFAVTSSGTINWSAPMGGMDSDGNHVVGTVLRDAGRGKTGFDIQFQTGTGNMHVASCSPQ